jgi:hypothetical protein
VQLSPTVQDSRRACCPMMQSLPSCRACAVLQRSTAPECSTVRAPTEMREEAASSWQAWPTEEQAERETAPFRVASRDTEAPEEVVM